MNATANSNDQAQTDTAVVADPAAVTAGTTGTTAVLPDATGTQRTVPLQSGQFTAQQPTIPLPPLGPDADLPPAAAAHPIPQAPFQGVPRPAPNPDQTRTFTITSFVLGIVSVVAGWTFIAPIVGLVFGIIALRRRTADRTLAIWGVVLNSIMLGATALAAFFGIAAVTFGALASIPYWGW
ncbi:MULTISPECIES: DUF4190 domain-containing protein [unclassified Leucobacter]|uniref:DUF4190 domain-containing protein n=1 Tax=unclassified Leucobacter TaxID=2621730 RepID=UPI000A442300|nr:DUF4190 domain-containing protein [Leucobacter sp. Ag1]